MNQLQREGICHSCTYYFEVEPLLWKVLDSSTGLLFAIDVIDQQQFYHGSSNRTFDGFTIYANNYEYSNLRAWLNGYNGSTYSVSDYSNSGFLNTAFSDSEKAKIEMTTVDNSVASTGYSPNPYVCGDTQDKIFILSYSEAKNSSYGLDSAKGRISKATDYASARGYSVEYYWLRSPSSVSDDCAGYVYYDGYFSSYNDDSIRNDIRVDYGEEGVRPAFRIKIS